ncbi:uncharacterized protein BDZ99DRAFT_464376 [Mytilinidion resinicola]|uniref:CFEM domain-containing protein n=1 Tax=Mytilinidion resinicola TaxID=574789 RepID=A0A6A6YKV9_9PEZI|nr:uncharacterized protein BDZ99DRAFT_464376 [Mytilinidion resinicola]KAF2808507.1 hypothetical protein BDZ99DRAFT_464376 [Mytilinidion resinicola]
MRLLTIVALFALAALAAAKLDINKPPFNDAPKCAQKCVPDALKAATCSVDTSDINCFCKDAKFGKAIKACVRKKCNLFETISEFPKLLFRGRD